MSINNIMTYRRYNNSDNKITLACYEVKLSELAIVGFCVNAGSNDDDHSGTAHFLEHLMFNNMKILDSLDKYGIEYNAATNSFYTYYYFTGHVKNVELMFNHLLNMLKYPNIDKKSVDRERKIILEENKIVADRYSTKLYDHLCKTYYKRTPIELSIGGSDESLREISAKSLLNFYNTYYTPENICFVMVGDIDNNLLDKCLKKLSKLSPNNNPYINENSFDKTLINENIISQVEPTLYIKQNKTMRQTYLSVTFGIPNFEDGYDYDILTKLLGTGFTSSLITRLRLQKNLIYSLECEITKTYDSGIFMINTEFGPDNTEGVLHIIMSVLKHYKKNLVTPQQLKKAKVSLKNDYLESSYSLSSSFNSIVSGLANDRNYNYRGYDFSNINLNKITAEGIRQLSRNIFVKNRMNIFMYGNCKVIDYNKIIKL